MLYQMLLPSPACTLAAVSLFLVLQPSFVLAADCATFTTLAIAVIAAVGGGVLVISIIVGAILYCCCCRKKNDTKNTTTLDAVRIGSNYDPLSTSSRNGGFTLSGVPVGMIAYANKIKISNICAINAQATGNSDLDFKYEEVDGDQIVYEIKRRKTIGSSFEDSVQEGDRLLGISLDFTTVSQRDITILLEMGMKYPSTLFVARKYREEDDDEKRNAETEMVKKHIKQKKRKDGIMKESFVHVPQSNNLSEVVVGQTNNYATDEVVDTTFYPAADTPTYLTSGDALEIADAEEILGDRSNEVLVNDITTEGDVIILSQKETVAIIEENKLPIVKETVQEVAQGRKISEESGILSESDAIIESTAATVEHAIPHYSQEWVSVPNEAIQNDNINELYDIEELKEGSRGWIDLPNYTILPADRDADMDVDIPDEILLVDRAILDEEISNLDSMSAAAGKSRETTDHSLNVTEELAKPRFTVITAADADEKSESSSITSEVIESD